MYELGAAFGRYGLPNDDLMLRLSPTITVVGGTVDSAYPISNWLANKPAKPVKFTTPNAQILFDFGTAVNITAFGAIYHNWDEGLPVDVSWGSTSAASTGTESVTVPAVLENGDTVSPWIAVPGSPTYRYWLLDIGGGSPGSNSANLKLGRPLFLGALRDLQNDVRWGVVQNGAYQNIVHPTLLNVETVYELGSERQSFVGEFALRHETPNSDAQLLISLFRSTRMNSRPWILVPDEEMNDIWMVRFDDPTWSRTFETLNHNIFPFRATQLSRGLDWP
jgi:hypothetical protein